MDLNNLLRPDAVVTLAPGLSKKKVLEMIGEIAARQCPQINAHAAFDAMLARERLGSTGIGNGIALPHGRMQDTDRVVAVVARLSQPIDFDAIDNQPVDLLFALLVPSDQCQAHLSTLAAIAKRLSDKDTLKKLRGASDDSEVYQILIENAA
ncbi:PTS IIA-like nitrogen regulatory protein PtsN [Gallaecimonas mangrovi]|uniref:PTS IIA-like nitrogen regulatory protein PtsN n=1 Tax=Gallaecimonas mangrovi TaxID=2291597 RepID=UPI000E20AA52|nr:PTS IIA-like nitrogen regulatory protein PtsN [Gallaecimonas mangrovi]